jgi:ActR/RegA family two-component response regulator
VRSLEILLVVDNETVAKTLSATLRRAGHQVTTSTTIAGTVETLMRRGPYLDVVMVSMRFETSFGDDVIQYSRKLAAGARLIVLREAWGHVEDIELMLPRPAATPNRLPTDSSN